jgi:hypothetical protein
MRVASIAVHIYSTKTHLITIPFPPPKKQICQLTFLRFSTGREEETITAYYVVGNCGILHNFSMPHTVLFLSTKSVAYA